MSTSGRRGVAGPTWLGRDRQAREHLGGLTTAARHSVDVRAIVATSAQQQDATRLSRNRAQPKSVSVGAAQCILLPFPSTHSVRFSIPAYLPFSPSRGESMRVGSPSQPSFFRTLLDRLKEHPLARVGPGLITGVADDDPSGIATYSQAGAQFGLGMLWTMPLAFPLMAAVQSMCANLGRVTGKGLAANIKSAFPPVVLYGLVSLLLVANALNIAADVAAMGEVAELVTGMNRHLMTALFVFVTLLLQMFVPYHRYVFFLKWLTLSLLAYAAVLFTVHVPWREVALRTVWPNVTFDASAAAVVVGVFGTTISPICSSGRPPKKLKTCTRITTAHRSCATRVPRRPNCAAFAGTPGAACSIRTSPPGSSCWPPRSRFTRAVSRASTRLHRPPVR